MIYDDVDSMHPHTYVRLTNGHALATFQYHGGHDPKSDGGGLVEFDIHGKVFRSGSAMDATAKGELIRPYSLVVVPSLDRVVSTNTSMHFKSDGETRTVQVWRLSDLKLLRTIVLPPGPRGSEHQAPGEPQLLADGTTVLIHTFYCGLYELDGVATDQPTVHHVKTFDGDVSQSLCVWGTTGCKRCFLRMQSPAMTFPIWRTFAKYRALPSMISRRRTGSRPTPTAGAS